ncbi:MAG: hypothetical protein JEZ12_15175 [Desulfobacterium sp.]|nr:hypothetical protein [Desulfobacterium sp.]
MGQDYFKEIVDESMNIGDYNLLKALYVMHNRDVKIDKRIKHEDKFVKVKERIMDDYINLINFYLENNRTNEEDPKYLVYKSIVRSQLDSVVEAYIKEHKSRTLSEN